MGHDQTRYTGDAGVEEQVEQESTWNDEQSKPKKKASITRDLVEMVILTALVFFLIRGAFQSFRVDGQSMENTLQSNELLIVNKAAFWQVPTNSVLDKLASGPKTGKGEQFVFGGPHRGDVVVFRAPKSTGNWGSDYIKRVIGLPGDRVVIRNDEVFVNGKELLEPYTHHKPTIAEPWAKNQWVVPQGDYFVMGDNRTDSSDSRMWGYVPAGNMIGKAEFTYWPLDSVGGIPSATVLEGMLRLIPQVSWGGAS